MSKLTNLFHETLPGGLITDLSNDHLLIEIKNAKHFRASFGQIHQYALYRPKAHKVICLFGQLPKEAILKSYIETCTISSVDLVWLFSEELYKILQEETIL
jgi:hypothetical protein